MKTSTILLCMLVIILYSCTEQSLDEDNNESISTVSENTSQNDDLEQDIVEVEFTNLMIKKVNFT